MALGSRDDRSGAFNSLRMAPVVLRDAGRVYRRHVLLIVPVAVVIFGVTGLALDALNEELNHPVEEAIDAGDVLAGVAILVLVLASSVFAELLFAGLLDHVVEAELAGRPPPSLAAVVGRVPYVRLLLADALVVVFVLVGLVLLVLPGIAALTLLGLAGPLVIAEGRGPWGAVRRSFELLRGRLGAAVLLVLVPNLVASSVDEWLTTFSERWSVIARVAAEVGVDTTLAAYTGLLLAVLARHLVSESGSDVGPG